ncbi:MAG: hypothetical protein GYB33_00710 [Gammaproteobacteria bacterium]|nr:hypothetical protein [Gammaproteobacteria bacterium]
MSQLAQVFMGYRSGLEQFRAVPELRITLYSGRMELPPSGESIDDVINTVLARVKSQPVVATQRVANQKHLVLEKVGAVFPAPVVQALVNFFYTDNIVQPEKE